MSLHKTKFVVILHSWEVLKTNNSDSYDKIPAFCLLNKSLKLARWNFVIPRIRPWGLADFRTRTSYFLEFLSLYWTCEFKNDTPCLVCLTLQSYILRLAGFVSWERSDFVFVDLPVFFCFIRIFWTVFMTWA